MRGRSEGKKRCKGTVLRMVPFFILFLGDAGLRAQHLPTELVHMLERKCERGGKDLEALVSSLEDLRQHPLNLNTATRGELEELPFLTPFMIGSLLDYRNEYGALLSWSELALVHGFDASAVRLLRPFFHLGKTDAGMSVTRKPVRQKMILRSRFRSRTAVRGLPLSLYARYRIDCADVASAGFTLENDPGEPRIPDFCSFYLHVGNVPLTGDRRYSIRALTVGDYSLRIGQGLLMWNSFSLFDPSRPSSVIRGGRSVLPYTSSAENGAYRGAAVELSLGRHFETLFFFSSAGRDARVEGDAFYTLPDSGLHVDEASLAAKDALTETVTGGHLRFSGRRFRLGMTALAYRYDRLDRRRTAAHNRHLRYDGWWGNLSLDFLFSFRGIRLFGEWALDRRSAFGGLTGIVLPLSSELECSALLRCYTPRFIAEHAGAVSTGSRCNNEYAATAMLRWTPSGKTDFSLYTDYARHPYPVYGARGASHALEVTAETTLSLSGTNRLSFRGGYRLQSGRRISKGSLRLDHVYESEAGFSAATRLAASFVPGKVGWLLSEELSYRIPSDRFRCHLRGTLFRVDDWNGRIYSHERDLPSSFSVPAYFGRGLSASLVIRWKPVRAVSLHAKWSGNLFPDHSENFMKASLQISLLF